MLTFISILFASLSEAYHRPHDTLIETVRSCNERLVLAVIFVCDLVSKGCLGVTYVTTGW